MRIPPEALLRGIGKLVAVVVAAGLAGALIGIGLAKLSGNEATSDPLVPATTADVAAAPERTQTTAPTTSGTSPAGTTSTTSIPGDGIYRVPRVRVLSARLGAASQATGRAVVAVRVSVTNRGQRPLTIKTPALVSGTDESPLGAGARGAAGRLLEPIAPGASATGSLRFSVAGAVAQRLQDEPTVRLRIANRTRAVTLTPSPAGG